MIARLVRGLWIVSVVVAALAAWWSVRTFGAHVGVVAAALVGVCAVYALHPLIVVWNFALSRWKGDPVPADLRIPALRAVGMVDAEIDAAIRGFWFATPFRSAYATPAPNAALAPRRLALLFVHGYFCNRAIWSSFVRDAASRGYACEAVTLNEGFAPIESHAPAIETAIASLIEATRALGRPVDRVVVIAHSMGGLVMRSALTTIDRTRIAHVITLGTPHHGTWPARFGRFANVVQMRVGSPWLAALAEAERDGAGLPHADFTTLYSAHDNIVYPQRTALLDGARAIRLSGIGHVALAFDRRVRDAVFERLEELALREPRR